MEHLLTQKEKLKEVLQDLFLQLKNIPGTYRLDGSCSLITQGINTNWNDIDLRGDKIFVETFTNKFKNKILQSGYDKKKFKHFVIIDFDGIEVEAARYDKENERDYFNEIKTTTRNDIKIPTVSLQTMLKFYQRINKESKINLIKNFLTQNN